MRNPRIPCLVERMQMAAHAGHATGIDKVQGLEGGATPGPLASHATNPLICLWILGPWNFRNQKEGNSRCLCSKQSSQPFHLYCFVFFRNIPCWAELHAPTLSWLVCVREGGLFNTSRHRGPSMSTETVYLYRLYQSYITIWWGEAIWKHKKPPRLISSLGDHFSREVCHCLLISTWKLVSLFNLETRRRMDQENTYMQRVI